MGKFFTFLAALIIAVSAFEMQAQTVRYVKAGGTGNGNSWANASGDLQLMINSSAPDNEIWVAEGIYKPNRPADDLTTIDPANRDNAFVLKADVKIYGGFNGDETSIAGRSGGASILSGDMNAYHVVVSAGNVGTATIDGFTITGGYAKGGLFSITVNGETVYRVDGGGMYTKNSSPTLNNVTISGNEAINEGGGMKNEGMYNNISSPTLTNVTIRENLSTHGGGIANEYSSPTLTNVTITGNSADEMGGGMLNSVCSPTLTNVTINGNSADEVGGMANRTSSSPTLTNVTISGNSAGDVGGIYNIYSSLQIQNSIIWGNTAGTDNNVQNDNSTATYSYSIVEGSSGGWGSFGTDGGNNMDADPLFVAPVAASSAPTTAGDYRLQAGSPAIDAGNSSLVPTGITEDPDGNPRISGGAVDMGAYEYQAGTATVAVTSIAVTGTGGATVITTNGGALQMLADVQPLTATDQTVTWSVIPAGTGSATVSADGLLTAAANGTVTVRATANDGSGVFGGRTVAISGQTSPPVAVTSVTVTGADNATAITTDGGMLQMLATVLPANATDKTVTWTVTSGTGGATVSADGLLTATANGTVTVRATTNDGSGRFGERTVTISGQPVPPAPVTYITVTGAGNATAITSNGGTLQMSADILPANATDNTVTWSIVPGTGGAAITPDGGLLSALANGTVTVRATANDGSGVYGERTVTLSGQGASATPVTSIEVIGTGGATAITTNGGTLRMLAAIQPATANIRSVTWTVTPGTGNATVSTGGLLTATANGTVTVTATANDGSGMSGEATVSVSGQYVPPTPATSVTVTGAGNAAAITTDGGTLQMSAAVLPADAADRTVAWSIVPGTGGASITAGGLLSALANGTVTVRATANGGNGVSGDLTVTVSGQTPPAVPVTSIAVTGATAVTTHSGALQASTRSAAITADGGALQMSADVQPATANIRSVTWTVTPGTGRATVSTGGLLVATTNGTVTVTATASDGSGVSGGTTITVSGQSPPPTFTVSVSAPATFDPLQTPYTLPAAQTVTVTNTGTGAVTLLQPAASNYDIGTLSATTLTATGETATFTVQPKADLPTGNHDETVTVSGNGGAVTARVAARFTVTAVPLPPDITAVWLPEGETGTGYSQPLAATGDAPIAWTVVAGSLPDGLNLSDVGLITGTPSAAGIFNFSVQASNAAGVYTRAFTVIIINPVANEAVSKPALGAWTHNGVLYVSGLTAGQSWSVYSILGRTVYRGVATGSSASIPLPEPGVYIVTDGKTAVKINN